MNKLLTRLGGGDLRSDGNANEVADEVIRNPDLFGSLIEGLDEPDDVIRARTAHAIEKISRTKQDLLLKLMPKFRRLAIDDKVPMVKWHLAMIFGNMSLMKEAADQATSALIQILDDDSVFVRSWAITSLALIGRRDERKRPRIIEKMMPLQNNDSIAVRTKAKKALDILQNENVPIPSGWSKSEDE
jgi:HEAT repeat protein